MTEPKRLAILSSLVDGNDAGAEQGETKMTTTEIRNGNNLVKIVEQGGSYTSRLYVNNGDTATLNVRRAKTLKGAEKQAQDMLARHRAGR